MDPQQRLLLEVAHEALEHAGIPADSLAQTQTGVFAGACAGDYAQLASTDLSQVDAWSGTGGALSIIANRVSYFFDLRGPSVTVDTACSSSLVAVHLACQSLRVGDSNLALAAGVNLLLSPAVTRSFDQAEAMSRSGQCHAFDASADGFVRGEGCGVAVLKRLSDALRDGDRVLAVVRGSAVNQDGRSNGLMAPNPAAQMAVLRAAYANAGVEPREVDYVEAHGTGTLLGDPIEARALGTVLGRGRPEDSPLLIGAVKSNLGHLEAAAGVAGFLKAVLAVQRGRIPANLGFHPQRHPHIPFENLRLKVVAEPTDWLSTGRPRRAGVSSFGFGGTNAHVVLEQGPDPDPPVAVPRTGAGGEHVGGVGQDARADRVVGGDAGRLDGRRWGGGGVGRGGAHPESSPGRAREVRHRVPRAIAPRRWPGCARWPPGIRRRGWSARMRAPCRAGTVFVYSGQGSQWAGMGRQLLADEPAFAAAVAELEPVFVEQTGFSLQQVLAAGEPLVGIDRIQPVLVGVQLALTELWRSYGVQPDAVIGHSMGEVSAAVVAGALSPADGLAVIATRSRLMSRLAGQGAMALLELDPEATAALIADYPDVTLAVYASPRQTVIAGPPAQVDAVIAVVDAPGPAGAAHRGRCGLPPSHHRSDTARVADGACGFGAAPRRRSRSSPPPMTTPSAGATVFDAEYWVANLRNPVRFSQAIATAGVEYGTFVEISPHPLLTYAITDTLAEVHHHSIGTLQRDTHDTLTFHTNLNATHTTHPPHTDHVAEPPPLLPTTPWHHTQHWITFKKGVHAGGSAPRFGTLLGEHIAVASTPPAHLWQARLVPEGKPYPGFHRIHGVEVVPISVLLQTLSAAAAECGASTLSDVRFERPIVVDQPQVIQVVADDESVTVSSAPAVDTPAHRWIRHVSARISHRPEGYAPEGPDNSGDHEMRGFDPSSVAELQAMWGIEGQPFPWSIGSCRSAPDGLHADVDLSEASTVALLDAAVHVARLVDISDPRLMVPAGVESVRLTGVLADARGSAEVRRRGGNGDELIVDIAVKASDGSSCIDLRGLRFADVESGPALSAPRGADPHTMAHAIEWQPWGEHADRQQPPDAPCTLAILGESDAARTLRDRFADAGYTAADVTEARYVLYLAEPDPVDAAETDIDFAVRLSAEVADLVHRLAERDYRHPAMLWIITRGVCEAVSDEALRQSCLWGLAGVIGAEQPQLWGGLVDIPVGDDIGDCASALSTVLPMEAKSILVLRDGQFLAPALVPVSGQPVREQLRCRPDAAYLITGGMGALGLLMAAWLADRGARRLVLAGRTPLPPRRDWDRDTNDADVRHKIAAIRALEMRGVTVDVVALDVGSRDAVQALLARRDGDGAPPIRGVIHAAGRDRKPIID